MWRRNRERDTFFFIVFVVAVKMFTKWNRILIVHVNFIKMNLRILFHENEACSSKQED